MDARFVGIDVSKDKLDVHTRPGGEKFVVSRDADGLDELIKRLKSVPAVAVGVEATGGFEQVVTATLAGAGMPVIVVNPAQVRAFARALGMRSGSGASPEQPIGTGSGFETRDRGVHDMRLLCRSRSRVRSCQHGP